MTRAEILAERLYRCAIEIGACLGELEVALHPRDCLIDLSSRSAAEEVDAVYSHAEDLSAAFRSVAMRLDRGVFSRVQD